MNEPTIAIDTSLQDLDKLRKKLKLKKDIQVRGQEERLLTGSVANAWFNSHSPKIRNYKIDLAEIDKLYGELLKGASATPLRRKLCASIDKLKSSLVSVKVSNATSFAKPVNGASEAPPDFSKLVKDPAMQQILVRRWIECENCVSVNAALASIVMMGGLLEALLLAKINAVGGITLLSKNVKSPKDKKGTVKPLNDWKLWDMIEVAHEEKWVSVTAKSVSHVLRDYRNWIHPFKELTAGVSLSSEDSRMLWQVAKEIAKQVLR